MKRSARECGQLSKLPILDRIDASTKKGPGCWTWIGNRSRRGYGTIKHKGKMWRVSRLLWTLKRGPIPKGKGVLHSCDNPPCVRLKHFFLGMSDDNNQDMVKKGRNAKGEKINTAKLTSKQVRQLRRLHCPYRVSARELGERFGITERQVWNILKNENWRHVCG